MIQKGGARVNAEFGRQGSGCKRKGVTERVLHDPSQAGATGLKPASKSTHRVDDVDIWNSRYYIEKQLLC